MFTAVVKPFSYAGQAFDSGDIVDSSGFRNEKQLLGARYLRALTPDEYAEAVGLVNSHQTEDELENTNDGSRRATESEPAGDEADTSYGEGDTSEDENPEEAEPPAPRALKAKAPAKSAPKATAKKTKSRKR